MTRLYFVGFGLYDITDISVKGLEVVQHADTVFTEFYTSVLFGSSRDEIQKFIGRKITHLTREEVEGEEIILNAASQGDVVLLTGGDPMSATTHQSLRLSAMKRNIEVCIIHGSSIFTALPGLLGLPIYKFGRTTTLVRPEKSFAPTSPYDIIESNSKVGLHTMVLLDIKEEENYFMTASEGCGVILDMERSVGRGVVDPTTMVGVVARAGSVKPYIWYGSLKDGMEKDFGPPLHAIVIPADRHFMEDELLQEFID